NFGAFKGITDAYAGDRNDVGLSLLHICGQLGADLRIASPLGHTLDPQGVELSRRLPQDSGRELFQTNQPHGAHNGAQVIYTDTWTSMGQEEEARQREAVFPPYQVNAALVREAAPEAIVMHCLPAHRGQEITDEVADGPQSRLF